MALQHEPDVGVGAWIASRLGRFGATVGSLVPRGFDAYVRVLHPVPDEGGRLVRWADVAAVTGRPMHPLVQLWRLAGRSGPYEHDRSVWPGGDPEIGRLEARTLTALLDVLAAHTDGGAAAGCVAALWEGWGWVDGTGVRTLTVTDDGRTVSSTGPGPAVPAEVLAAPRFELPHRGYLLFRGSLSDVPTLGHHVTPEWFEPQSPSLLWPADRTWCVATEVDLDSTVVAGSRELITAVLADPRLESYPVTPDDSLAHDADPETP